MSRPFLEVADIFRRHAPDYPYPLSPQQARVLQAISVCRTAQLGGHVERCDTCGHQRIAYNSCRDRHCPKCQSLEKARWVAKQTADLLPVPYFHVVFTVPAQLVGLALQNPKILYDILFRTTGKTLLTIAADKKHLGAEIGLLAVLHTWGQNLQAHPHLHCIVPGGGLSTDGQRWVASSDKFFLPVRVLSRLYRGLFVSSLKAAYSSGSLEFHGRLKYLARPRRFQQLLRKLSKLEWVVYAKKPFAGPEKVVDYVGRYTHRVAISNNRLKKLDDGKVQFRWKDYRRSRDGDGNVWSLLTLDAHEFIRRFLLHVLPRRFVRIRRYGILCNRNRGTKLGRCRELLQTEHREPTELDWRTLYTLLTGRAIEDCPKCRGGQMKLVDSIPSLKERLRELRLGRYLPRMALSRAMATCFLRKVNRLEPLQGCTLARTAARLDSS